MSHLPVIVVVDDGVIRATHGLTDLVSRPTVEVAAFYGAPKQAAPSRNGPDANGDIAMNGSSTESPAPSRSEWLIGEALDGALANPETAETIDIRYPFAPTDGKVDWDGREFVLAHIYSLLKIKPTNNTHALLFVPPASSATLPLSEQELYCQMAFESLNTPQFAMFPTPLVSLLGMNAVTGVVLHIGRTTSTVAVVTDSVVRWECATTVDIGEVDCEQHLERLLLADARLDKELLKAAEVEMWAPGQKEKLVRQVREFIFAECTSDDIEIPVASGASQKVVMISGTEPVEEDGFDVAKKLTADAVPQAQANPSHKSKKQLAAQAAAAASKAQAAADAAEAADVIVVTIPALPEKEITVGSVRHRMAEPLLRGKTPGGDTVWETLGRAVESTGLNAGEKMQVWEALGVIGNMARFKSLPISIATYVGPYLLSSSDLPSDSQPGRVRLLSIPDYFANYKGCNSDLAPFLGASMVTKLAFNESHGKHYVAKMDYNAHGPAAIYGVWAEAV